MTLIQRAAHLAHAHSAAMKRRIQEASLCTEQGLAQTVGEPYVAFSAGKDSAAMLHLVHRLLGPVQARIILWPESDLVSNFTAILHQWRARWSAIDLRVVQMHRGGVADAVADRWDAIHDDRGTFFTGLRADESRARRMTLRSHGTVYRMKTGRLRVAPLAWWTSADVAAYVVSNDLPTLDNYLQGGFAERTATRVPRKQVRERFLEELRARDPQGFNRLVLMYPELG